MTRRRITIVAIFAVLVLAIVAGAGVLWLSRANGFSARTQPTLAERVVMRALHRWSVPSRARDTVNPIAFSSDAWAESRAHFADHCASCHGNDGQGDTELGRSLFPKAPDMRLGATQKKTDGELYWIIENGIRLTGMPAWGKGGGDDADTWKLVHFIRHLGELTPEHLKAMAAANPRSPAEIEEEKEDERFLAGDDHHH